MSWRLRLVTGRQRDERGDVPGWVLITVMTAGLVAGLWAIAGRAAERDAARCTRLGRSAWLAGASAARRSSTSSW